MFFLKGAIARYLGKKDGPMPNVSSQSTLLDWQITPGKYD